MKYFNVFEMSERTRRSPLARLGALTALMLIATMMLMPAIPVHAQKAYTDATGGFLNETLFVAAAAYTTSNSAIAPVDLGGYASGLLVINVTAVSGTTPSMTVNFQTCYSAPNTQSPVANANCVTHTASSAITAAGVYLIKPLANFARWNTVSYAITGTTPSFTFSAVGYFKPTS